MCFNFSACVQETHALSISAHACRKYAKDLTKQFQNGPLLRKTAIAQAGAAKKLHFDVANAVLFGFEKNMVLRRGSAE